MKIKIAFTIVMMLCVVIAQAQNTLSLGENHTPPIAQIEDVAWIAGHWKGTAFGGVAEEIWSPPLGNSMMAVFRLVKENKTEFYEIETISEENESLILRLKHFNHNLKAWEEKDETENFPLVKLKTNKAYFDGLTFEKISDQEMNIYVVIGEENGKQDEMKFPYRLVK